MPGLGRGTQRRRRQLFTASSLLAGARNAVTELVRPPLEAIALNRLAFGPRPGDLEAFRQLPGESDADRLRVWVDQQLNPFTIDDSACSARLANSAFVTLDKSLPQLWADHVVNPPAQRGYEWTNLPLNETIEATILRAAFSQRQLLEVLVDFWHNHFNVFRDTDGVPPVFVHYDRDVIRANALGNFRKMLEDVGTSPAMLFYLDNNSNQVAGPNENYARELFELHTLGAASYFGVQDPRTIAGFDEHASLGYVDNDVYEAARAFTGWRVDSGYEGEEGLRNSGTFLYFKPWHDRFNKTILGHYLPHDQGEMQDGRDVFDILATHPGTATHIATKLARRLIGDRPPADVIVAAANVFLAEAAAPDQLAQVVRSIVLSNAFAETWGEKIKRPFEVAVAMLRALNVDFTRLPDNFLNMYEAMGQPLFGHPAPNGYGDMHQNWSGTTSLLYRWKLAAALAENAFDDGKLSMRVNLVTQTPPSARSANAATDFWIERILGRPIAPTDRAEIARAMAQADHPDAPLGDETFAARIPQMVELIVMSPEFQWR